MASHPTYDLPLVALSVLVAVLASYAALDLTGRITAATGRARLAWHAGGSVAMGVGIWSMHFIGMLAYRMPGVVHYRSFLVLLSIAIAIAASALVLYFSSRSRLSPSRLILSGIGLGLAIAGMHYTGMAAVDNGMRLTYRTAPSSHPSSLP